MKKKQWCNYWKYAGLLLLICLMGSIYRWRILATAKEVDLSKERLNLIAETKELDPPAPNVEAPAARGRVPKREIPISDEQLDAEVGSNQETDQKESKSRQKAPDEATTLCAQKP